MTVKLPKAVLFDWDNTLVDTWPVIHAALHDTFVMMGHTPWTLEEVKQRVARSMRDAFPGLFGDDWQKAADAYRSHYRSIHLDRLESLPGAEEVLKRLKAQGVRIGIVSNKVGDTLRLEVPSLGWAEYFDVIIGATDAAQDKPHAAPVLMALEKMGIPAGEDVWFIGDSEVDLEVAQVTKLTAHLYGDVSPDDGKPGYYRGIPFHFQHKDHRALLEMLNKV